jgi:molybdopterin-guanine dinucleotide biosynthesis protein A
MKLGVVVLAGGEGRRIGGNKPGRLLAGRTLLDHILAKVESWQLPAALSVRGAIGERMEVGLPLLPDEEGSGPIAGVASALRFAVRKGLDAVLTLPCDTPLAPLDLPERLAAVLGGRVRAAAAESGGRLHPSCCCWATGAAAEMLAYLGTSRRSLSGFAERLNVRSVEWPIEPFDPFLNINSEEDLAEAERIFRSR